MVCTSIIYKCKMSVLWILVCLCIIGKHVSSNDGSSNEDRLKKRQINSLPLVFPYGATYKLQIGFVGPVVPTDIGLLFLANFQYQYRQFENISELSQYYFIKEVSREEREVDMKNRKEERLIFYRSFANLLDSRGLNGLECVLRAICEAAQYPVEEEGLVAEIFHILLTPDYGRSPFDPDPDWDELMSQYVDAVTAGRQMFSCSAIYSDCPQGQGVLELISVLSDE